MLAIIGSIILALCGLPEAIRSYKRKRCDIGWSMLLLWFTGELCLTVFAIQSKQYSLLINYITNIIAVAIMLYYKSRKIYEEP